MKRKNTTTKAARGPFTSLDEVARYDPLSDRTKALMARHEALTGQLDTARGELAIITSATEGDPDEATRTGTELAVRCQVLTSQTEGCRTSILESLQSDILAHSDLFSVQRSHHDSLKQRCREQAKKMVIESFEKRTASRINRRYRGRSAEEKASSVLKDTVYARRRDLKNLVDQYQKPGERGGTPWAAVPSSPSNDLQGVVEGGQRATPA